jgi:hypothetical protein
VPSSTKSPFVRSAAPRRQAVDPGDQHWHGQKPDVDSSPRELVSGSDRDGADDRSDSRLGVFGASGSSSADEAAMPIAKAKLSRQYRSEDINQQAIRECIEQLGSVFPLSELSERRR